MKEKIKSLKNNLSSLKDNNKIPILFKLSELLSDQQEYQQALEYSQQALKLSKKSRNREFMLKSYDLLYLINKNQKNYQQARKNLNSYLKIYNKIHEQENRKILKKLEKQYKLEDKERDTEISKFKNEQLEKINTEIQKAIDQVNTLTGLLPICPECKKIKDDQGYWKEVDEYISEHSDSEVSHGICPECAKKYFPHE
jgi:tetratricopeptide (TPR) repeat protein